VEATKDRVQEFVQEFTVNGDQVVAKVKELVREGNVRRLIIKNEQGSTLIEVPLTIGVIGAALLPVFAAIGALAALATRCTIVVEREEPSADGRERVAPTG
jgi:Flp pilus assembly pilin Flp